MLGSIVAAALVAGASPSSSAAAPAAPAGQVWALALPASVKTVQQKQMSWLAARGVTTIVAFKRPQASLNRLAATAKKSRLVVIAPKQVAPKKACKSAAGSLRACAAVVGTPAAAVRLARRGLVDYVVIRVKTPLQLRMLRGSHAKRSRIVALLPLNQKAAGKAAWRAGIAYAAADPALDLGVTSAPGARGPLGTYLSQLPRTRTAAAVGQAAPTSLLVTGRSTSSVMLRWTAAAGGAAGYGVYADGNFVLNVSAVSITLTGLQCGRSYTFGVDAYDDGGARSGRITTSTSTDPCAGGGGGGGGGSSDVLPPTAPLGLVKGTSTQTSIAVSWTASTDNIGVAGYGLYRNGTAVGSSVVAVATFSGLTCGTTYTLAVDAYDAVGNRSGTTSLSAATSACAGGVDTTAPSTPGTLTKTGSTMTSISVSWGASTDNVGVTGYGLYRNGSSTGTSATTSATFSGLACGSSYTLAVDAYDAAGNRSSQRSLTTATSACPPPTDTQAPSVPQGMAFTGQTQTTVALSWNASTDNVGVAGYRLFKNDVSVTTVATPGYTYTGLTCGTSYTFAIEAYDAAGNASNRTMASGTTSTSACSGPPPPPPPPAPAPGVANLWVDTNGGSCARQATAGSWVDSQACSWNQAYQTAQTGDLILVRGGSYGNVTIGPNKASIAAPGVTFRTASGESVVVNDLENGHIAGGTGGSNISFVGPATARTFRSDQASNVVVDDWNVDCNGCDGIQMFHLEAADNVVVRNSELQDNKNNSLIWISGSNLTFENNRIHDAGLPNGSAAHTECIYAWSVTNLTLRRNHFYHCSVMDVFITGSSVANGGIVENNVFEKPWENTGVISNSAYAFHFRNGGSPPTPDPNNWDFRYNTFVGPLSISTDANPVGSGGMRVIGNVFLSGSPCGLGNTTYSYNAFVSGACGTSSVTNSLATYLAGFTGTGDPGVYSLQAGSVLRDKGNPANYPTQDRTGASRYNGAAPDLGAYEGT
jgi:chitodextrinase